MGNWCYSKLVLAHIHKHTVRNSELKPEMSSRYLMDLCMNDCKTLLKFIINYLPGVTFVLSLFSDTTLHYSQPGLPTAPGWHWRPWGAAEFPRADQGCFPSRNHQDHSTSSCQELRGARNIACFCLMSARLPLLCQSLDLYSCWYLEWACSPRHLEKEGKYWECRYTPWSESTAQLCNAKTELNLI